MKKEAEFPDTIFAVAAGGSPILVIGHPDLKNIMDGPWFEENSQSIDDFPTKPGVYRCTIEYYFQMGYYEGYPAPGESDWDLKPVDIQEIVIETQPADDANLEADEQAAEAARLCPDCGQPMPDGACWYCENKPADAGQGEGLRPPADENRDAGLGQGGG